MIRPFFTPEEKDSPTKQALCQEILDDADAWARQLYDNQYVGDYLAKHGYVVFSADNQYVGDYLAKHGYVVFSADAPMWGERLHKQQCQRSNQI